MVLPAVLRHPARHPRQAGRRDRHVRLDRRAVPAALARHLARALLNLPADLQMVHACPRGRRDRAGLVRRQPAGGLLCAAGPGRHALLFLPLPHPAADPGQDRTAIADAAQHRRRGAQEEGGLKICANSLPPAPLRWLPSPPAPSPSLPSLKSIRRIGTGTSKVRSAPSTAPPPSAATRSMPRSAPPAIRWSCCTIATWWISA